LAELDVEPLGGATKRARISPPFTRRCRTTASRNSWPPCSSTRREKNSSAGPRSGSG